MRYKIILFCISCIISVSVNAQQLADSIKSHLDSALLIMQQHSFYSKNVNWSKLRQDTYNKAAGAKTKAETSVAISDAFKELNDRHGMFAQYKYEFRVHDSTFIKRLSPELLYEWKKGVKVKIQMLGDVAYLLMPSMPVGTQPDIDREANLLNDSIAKLATQHPKAWIIDLRLNGGGNFRPMLGGISSFFDNGVIFSFLDKDRKSTDPVSFDNGQMMIDKIVQCNIKTALTPMHQVNIAVLIGPGTGSSGEATALALQLRKHTKLIGTPTAGYTNSTQGYWYNNGATYFLLTTARYGDRNRNYMPVQLQPDIAIESNNQFSNILTDNVVQAALKWLR